MQNSKPIRILVVDDHFMVRMGLFSSLNVEPDIEVVAEAGSGEAALEAYRKYHPSLVMMDLRLPGMSGIDCTAALIREFPDACILILSTHSGEEEIYRAMHAGARGYVVKSIVREELLRGPSRRTVFRSNRRFALGRAPVPSLAEQPGTGCPTIGSQGIREQGNCKHAEHRGSNG